MNKVLGVIIAIVLLCLCVSLTCALIGVVVGTNVLENGDVGAIAEQIDEFLADVSDGDFYFEYDSDSNNPVTTPVVVDADLMDSSLDVAELTLENLKVEVVPIGNFDDLAVRLRGVGEVPAPPTSPVKFYAEGDLRDFNVSNSDNNFNFTITARLEKVTEHAYFWIEDGISFDKVDLNDLASEFENQIYPTNQEFFGSEWSPGIDGDGHIYILYASGLGNTVAGYYSSADESNILSNPYSNMVELFVFNSDAVRLDEEYTKGVLAHEYQHMIHWNLDSNETSWLNEGFSELAAFLNGYDPGGFDYSFMHSPDYQLNNWPADGNTSKNYGSSFLFADYLLNRLGEEMTRAIVANEANGFDSIDDVLQTFGTDDDLRGSALTADDLVQDWMIANYLQDGYVADGRFVYENYVNAPQANSTVFLDPVAGGSYDYDVNQYGADYLKVDATNGFSMAFDGGEFTTLLPTTIQDGDFAYWSNKGDASDMRLTGYFDFGDVDGPLTLTFSTWFDIEEGWDYVYLLYSDDDGASWHYLKSENGTDYDPQGNNYGFGWSSTSDGWIDEEIDISELAGKDVMIRFEYVTDAAVNNEGMLIDSLAIPEIGYATSFETEDDVWVSEGFVRVNHLLPQTFNVAALVEKDGIVTVEYLSLDGNEFEYAMDAGEADSVTFVISGTTRFTRQRATYSVSFE
jgi:hypothetical protein